MTAVYTFDYDTSYNPPIPIVKLRIGPIRDNLGIEGCS